MSYKTQKIAAQIKKFNASDYAGNLINVFGALKHRPLGHKHFEQAKTQLQKMMEAAKEATVSAHLTDTQEANPAQKLEDRRLSFSLVYMTVSLNDEDILVPVSIRGLISQEMGLYCTYGLPLRVSSQHLEFRHIQRTAEPLNYHSGDFKYALAFSLAMSAVLERTMTKDSPPVPCLIPHTSGVFLGVAQHEGRFWSNTQAAFRNFGGKGPFVGTLTGSRYGSPVTIELRTSLGWHEISERQIELREELLLPDFPGHERIMARGMDIHALCQMHDIIPQREKDEWSALCFRLERAMSTTLWREESQRALSNLKRHDYN